MGFRVSESLLEFSILGKVLTMRPTKRTSETNTNVPCAKQKGEGSVCLLSIGPEGSFVFVDCGSDGSSILVWGVETTAWTGPDVCEGMGADGGG